MECAYLKAIRSKYSNEVIKAFHVCTNGVIYCPICRKDHEFKEEEEHAEV